MAISKRDWYSVSVKSIQRWLTFLVLVVLLAVAYTLYRHWEEVAQQQEAIQVIETASRLLRQVEQRESLDGIAAEHAAARDSLEGARSFYAENDFAKALANAKRSRVVLESILQIGRPQGGTIRFVNVRGEVLYRRGEQGTWRRARPQDSINPSDWVKTADGSAELMFADGTLYTLRRDTMVHLGGARAVGDSVTKRSTDIVFGRVELNTSKHGSTVKTPRSEAEVGSESEALVAYDEDSRHGQFVAYGGGMEVRSESGESRRLSALQKVEQRGAELSSTESLPEPPRLLGPGDNSMIDADEKETVRLSWERVGGAARYAIQVSDSRLFRTTIIEDEGRRKNSATLGIQGEGSFYWKVAAQTGDGLRGPWSEIRTFRVASQRGLGSLSDTTPPALELRDAQPMGSLVLISGRTEPGASVTVNEEPISVKLDGTFSKTIQMTQVGWNFITVVATDAAGNERPIRTRVFIEDL